MATHREHPAPVALITGASSGIGKATAEEFAARGYAVVVLARRKDLLDKLVTQLRSEYPGATFVAVRCDISKWADIEHAVGKIAHELGHVDVLVNNAGAYDYGSLEKCPPQKVDEMIDVNVRGVIYMTKACLSLLRRGAERKGFAKVVNVSSIGGLWGFSNMSVYTATKFAVTGFSSALRRELREEGIDVASIHPGPVISQESGEKKTGRKRLVMLPRQIARQIVSLATSKKRRVISHPAFSILNALEALSPEFVDKVLKKIL